MQWRGLLWLLLYRPACAMTVATRLPTSVRAASLDRLIDLHAIVVEGLYILWGVYESLAVLRAVLGWVLRRVSRSFQLQTPPPLCAGH